MMMMIMAKGAECRRPSYRLQSGCFRMTLCSQLARNILFTGFATRALLSFDYPLFHGRLSFIAVPTNTLCALRVVFIWSCCCRWQNKEEGRHPGRQSLYNGNSFIWTANWVFVIASSCRQQQQQHEGRSGNRERMRQPREQDCFW